MKTIFTISLLFFSICLQAQKETFDIATYSRPKDSTGLTWNKEVNPTITSYTVMNKKDNSWCRINIVKSTGSKGSIEKDFASEWQDLIEKNYKLTGTPQLNDATISGDWNVKAGASSFTYNNSNAMALLTTMSGNERCVSIVATTNSLSFMSHIETFLSSVELNKPENVVAQAPVPGKNDNAILGTWVINASDQSSFRVKNGVMSTIWRQYTLNANGTYSFVSKLFDPLMDKMLLGKETGTFTLSGNSITIIPQQSVLEAWSKKNNTWEWGKKLSSQKIALEKVTYQFSKYYNSTFNEWKLNLSANKQTVRDGPFNSSSDVNTWVYIAATSTTLIKLPGQ